MAGILAFDAAKCTGWAWVSPDGATRHGLINLRDIKDRGALFVAFRDRVADLMVRARPDWVFIEAPFVRGPVTRLTFGLAAIVEAESARAGVPFSEAAPASVKKHITGSGKADKAAMMAAIRGKGFAPEDDNAADAIAVAHFAWNVKFGGGA